MAWTDFSGWRIVRRRELRKQKVLRSAEASPPFSVVGVARMGVELFLSLFSFSVL